MIYWSEVKKTLIKYCPPATDDWSLSDVVRYLNERQRLSMKKIADMTEGKCGRTSLCLRMKGTRGVS